MRPSFSSYSLPQTALALAAALSAASAQCYNNHSGFGFQPCNDPGQDCCVPSGEMMICNSRPVNVSNGWHTVATLQPVLEGQSTCGGGNHRYTCCVIGTGTNTIAVNACYNNNSPGFNPCDDPGHDCCSHAGERIQCNIRPANHAYGWTSPVALLPVIEGQCVGNPNGRYKCCTPGYLSPPSAPTTVPDGNLYCTNAQSDQNPCTDAEQDCCAHPSWGTNEPQTCADGLTPVPTGTCNGTPNAKYHCCKESGKDAQDDNDDDCDDGGGGGKRGRRKGKRKQCKSSTDEHEQHLRNFTYVILTLFILILMCCGGILLRCLYKPSAVVLPDSRLRGASGLSSDCLPPMQMQMQMQPQAVHGVNPACMNPHINMPASMGGGSMPIHGLAMGGGRTHSHLNVNVQGRVVEPSEREARARAMQVQELEFATNGINMHTMHSTHSSGGISRVEQGEAARVDRPSDGGRRKKRDGRRRAGRSTSDTEEQEGALDAVALSGPLSVRHTDTTNSSNGMKL